MHGPLCCIRHGDSLEQSRDINLKVIYRYVGLYV